MKKQIVIWNKRIATACGAIAAFLMIVILVVILVQVICRYVLLVSTPWAEELARYVFVALCYIGGGLGVYSDSFVAVDLIDKVFEKKKNGDKILKVINKISLIFTVLFLGYFIVIYSQHLGKTIKLGQYSAALRMNMAIPMFFLLLGCIFMFIHALVQIFIPIEEQKKILAECKGNK